ncbi:MAG: hypothetical protein LBH24_05040 [Clostridiales bacterium]|jgi:hypothetical protein|nr:hypothetical protein [Clostridiales bacterium]
MAKKNGSGGSFFNNLAFVVIILLGVAMVVGAVLNALGGHSQVVDIIRHACLAVAILITVAASYYGTRGKKKMWFWIWLVAAILVVLGYVLSVIPLR